MFDTQKLDWVNSTHLKATSAVALYDYMKQVMMLPLDTHLSGWSYTTVTQLIDLYKQRCATLLDVYHELVRIHARPTKYEISLLTVEQKKLLDIFHYRVEVTEFYTKHYLIVLKNFVTQANQAWRYRSPYSRCPYGKKRCTGYV